MNKNLEYKVIMQAEALLSSDRIQKIAKAAKDYINQPTFNPTQADFETWLDSLHEPMKTNFRKKGLEKCRDILIFERLIRELNEQSMNEYMKLNLSVEDYAYWLTNQ